MKKILTALLISLATSAQSQITISSADLSMSGDQFVISTGVAFAGMDPTLTGAGYTWDYSQLTSASQATDTIFDEAATGSLLSLFFIDNAINPNRSNQCRHGNSFSAGQINVSDVWDFYYNSSSSFSQQGFGAIVNGAPLPVAYSPKDIVYRFPMNYLSADTSPSGYTLDLTTTIGIYYNVEKVRTNVVDGWGSITTPYGTFDALRVMSTIVETDSIYIDSLGFGFTTPPITTVEYKWLAQGQGVPVLQINTATGGTVTRIAYLDSMMNTSADDLRSAISEVVVFPNPASHELFVKYEGVNNENLSLEIYSLKGELITRETELKNNGGNIFTGKVDLEKLNLTAATYVVRIVSDGKVVGEKTFLAN